MIHALTTLINLPTFAIMHTHITNASLQLIPLGQERHPYAWVDEVIALIHASGLSYTVGPFGTSVEGSYTDVLGLIDAVQQYLYQKGCSEWLLQVQWQMRSTGPVTIAEKVDPHQQLV